MSGPGINAYRSIVLPATADYLIEIFPTHVTTAPITYTLDLRILPVDTSLVVPTIEQIQFATGTVSATEFGILQRSHATEYVFHAAQGQHLDLSITGALIHLISPQNGTLAIAETTLNGLVLPVAGDYRIVVYDDDTDTTHSDLETWYSLTITITGSGITPIVTPIPPDATEPTRIHFLQGMTSAQENGVLFGDEIDTYVFRAFANQQLSLQLNAGTATLISPQGVTLGTISTDPGEVHILNHLLTETGDYQIHISGLVTHASVAYVLTLTINN